VCFVLFVVESEEMTPLLLASTTSHKAEPLLPALDIFSRLGLRDIDLNLHHILEVGVPVQAIQQEVAALNLRLHAVSGGWCDFFHAAPEIDRTFKSVDRQVGIARALGVSLLRLFFGRLKVEQYSTSARDRVCDNLRRLSDAHHGMRFVFENHDGASLHPDICLDVLARVDRPNIRMNFDPINFERVGVNSLQAASLLAPYVSHAHLKGLDAGEFCEFGVGDVNLVPVLRTLKAAGYAGGFSVEYEGSFDKTLRLYESVKRARAVLQELHM
jgi:sugar phosphate isomerase/epimerase